MQVPVILIHDENNYTTSAELDETLPPPYSEPTTTTLSNDPESYDNSFYFNDSNETLNCETTLAEGKNEKKKTYYFWKGKNNLKKKKR